MNTRRSARALLWAVAKLFKQPEITFEPSEIKPQFEPGDFRKKNSVLLEQTQGFLITEQLWLHEAMDAENPARKMECRELARAHRAVYDAQKAFYSRWDIPEE